MIFGKNQGEDLLAKFSPDTLEGIKGAPEKAAQFNSPYIEPEHILLAILDSQPYIKLLEAAGVDAKKVQESLFSKLKPGDFHGQPEFSRHSISLFNEAVKLSENEGSEFVTPYHLTAAFFADEKNLATQTLLENKLDIKKLQHAQSQVAVKKEQKEPGASEGAEAVGKTGAKTVSVIETYTTDLTEKAKAGKLDPVVARDTEITRVMEILMRRTKNNPVLVGDAGVGKTAVVEGLAQKIVSGQPPEPLKNKKILTLDLSLLVAGAKHRGEFEERLNKLIHEIKAAAGQIILFIDEFHTIVGAGAGEGSLDASNILKPPLSRGELQAIGATTVKEFRQYIEKDAAFERRFQRVMVNEPSAVDATKMVEAVKTKYEQFHKVNIKPEAVKAAVVLSQRYISDRFLPDKAIDIVDESCSRITLKGVQPREVTVEIVKEVISEWSGVPVTSLTQDETKILMELDQLIHKKLVDQNPAVKAVVESIRRNRAGLKNPKRPVGSFIFMGPTGVGKTQLAKTLAEVMFGSEDKLIRLDMSEYMEKNATARMIGAPPGYVGYEEGGQLTEMVRKKPYSVVLFDEIEKAHKEVFNIFLQILDDGRLTDNKGRTIDFKNTIVICTSNIGTELIKKSNIDDPELQKILLAELQKFFRPEFINRFDDVIAFRGLKPEDMSAIVEIMIKEVSSLLKEQEITLEISSGAKAQLARLGYDPVFGARPLRRMVQKSIENPLSSLIIEKKITPKSQVKIDIGPDGKFSFTPTAGVAHSQNQPPSGGDATPQAGDQTNKPVDTAQNFGNATQTGINTPAPVARALAPEPPAPTSDYPPVIPEPPAPPPAVPPVDTSDSSGHMALGNS